MKLSAPIISLAVGFGLLAAVAASAQEIALPDRAHLQAMSAEEYAAYRELLRTRAEGVGAADRRLMRGAADNLQLGGRNTGGYGQGYAARNGQGGGGRHR